MREEKPYTIMVYMNGSDLESKDGAATKDMLEMLNSGLDSNHANLILFTGGTNRWHNNVVPQNECMIWEIRDGEIYELANLGLVNMGNPETLTNFINVGINHFPAEKYGLILWDHGGGSIAGYGSDEKFNDDYLTLLELNAAFGQSALANTRLEFLGFDSCLMASVEMAAIASNYANYLIASEDLTPGDGWDYHFLSVLNEKPSMSGEEIGVAITDSFMDFYWLPLSQDLNMSVIDLSKIDRVMDAMGKLMQKASKDLAQEGMSTFKELAKRRSGTRTFGQGSPRDNDSDMVDIGDMAYRLSDLYPEEAAEVFASLNEVVRYNRNNDDVSLSGLSTFYLYGGRDTAKETLETYDSLLMDDAYTSYLHEFSIHLLELPMGGERLHSEDKALPIEIGGKKVRMYPISNSGGRNLYAVPAQLNGKDCDIIVLSCGKILGYRENGFIFQKGYDQIEEGDRVSFWLYENNLWEMLPPTKL